MTFCVIHMTGCRSGMYNSISPSKGLEALQASLACQSATLHTDLCKYSDIIMFFVFFFVCLFFDCHYSHGTLFQDSITNLGNSATLKHTVEKKRFNENTHGIMVKGHNDNGNTTSSHSGF